VSVSVVDHGPGVPPDRVDELFGRFARLGSTRRGLGLGLYLSRSIARRHGGDVVHQPTPGGGATFTLTLPAHSEER
jgi:two-component system OmpR family sensor kinase